MQYCGCPPSTTMERRCCMACRSWIHWVCWRLPSQCWRWHQCALYAKTLRGEHVTWTSLHLLEASEVKPQHRLKLLLLYGQVLVVDHLLTRVLHAQHKRHSGSPTRGSI